jgi:hypothetical protein
MSRQRKILLTPEQYETLSIILRQAYTDATDSPTDSLAKAIGAAQIKGILDSINLKTSG